MSTNGRFIDVGGGSLWAETAGSGTPIVLVHGFSFDLTTWDDQFTAFSRSHQVTRYDLRGFGRSSVPAGPYSHVDDLLQVLQQTGNAPAHVVGLSLGANVALSLALTQPRAVCSIVLAASGLPGHAWTEDRPPDAALAHAKSHGMRSAKAFWLAHPLFASVNDRPPVAAKLRRVVDQYSGWHWENDNPMRPFEATRERLAEVKTPALVVSGERDVEGYLAIARELADGIEGARLVRMAGAGHLVNMEEPLRFNEQVLAFTARVDDAREHPVQARD